MYTCHRSTTHTFHYIHTPHISYAVQLLRWFTTYTLYRMHIPTILVPAYTPRHTHAPPLAGGDTGLPPFLTHQQRHNGPMRFPFFRCRATCLHFILPRMPAHCHALRALPPYHVRSPLYCHFAVQRCAPATTFSPLYLPLPRSVTFASFTTYVLLILLDSLPDELVYYIYRAIYLVHYVYRAVCPTFVWFTFCPPSLRIFVPGFNIITIAIAHAVIVLLPPSSPLPLYLPPRHATLHTGSPPAAVPAAHHSSLPPYRHAVPSAARNCHAYNGFFHGIRVYSVTPVFTTLLLRYTTNTGSPILRLLYCCTFLLTTHLLFPIPSSLLKHSLPSLFLVFQSDPLSDPATPEPGSSSGLSVGESR